MENHAAPHLVLASQSTIRAELLRNAGLVFDTCPAHVDEAGLIAKLAGQNPATIAIELASAKAEAAARNTPEALVIGADQLLVVDDAILQKPASLIEARERLMLLQGRTHRLVTGVALISKGKTLFSHVENAHLTMHSLSSDQVDQALAQDPDAVLHSVGAYRLEGPGITLFSAIEGDYFAMLGLPLVSLLSAIRQFAPQHFDGAANL